MKRISPTAYELLRAFVRAPGWRGVADLAQGNTERQRVRRALCRLARAGLLKQRTEDGRAQWALDKTRIDQAARILARPEAIQSAAMQQALIRAR